MRARRLRELDVIREVVGAHALRGPDHQRYLGSRCQANHVTVIRHRHWSRPHWHLLFSFFSSVLTYLQVDGRPLPRPVARVLRRRQRRTCDGDPFPFLGQLSFLLGCSDSFTEHSPGSPADGALVSSLLFMAFNDINEFLPWCRGLCWSPLYELLRVSLLFVVPSYVVPCCFTHGLVQEVSSVQTLASCRQGSDQTHRCAQICSMRTLAFMDKLAKNACKSVHKQQANLRQTRKHFQSSLNRRTSRDLQGRKIENFGVATRPSRASPLTCPNVKNLTKNLKETQAKKTRRKENEKKRK